MLKTPTQEKLEAQRQLSIDEILAQTLAQYQGQRGAYLHAAAELGISIPTLYRWCKQWDIPLDDSTLAPELSANPQP